MGLYQPQYLQYSATQLCFKNRHPHPPPSTSALIVARTQANGLCRSAQKFLFTLDSPTDSADAPVHKPVDNVYRWCECRDPAPCSHSLPAGPPAPMRGGACLCHATVTLRHPCPCYMPANQPHRRGRGFDCHTTQTRAASGWPPTFSRMKAISVHGCAVMAILMRTILFTRPT